MHTDTDPQTLAPGQITGDETMKDQSDAIASRHAQVGARSPVRPDATQQNDGPLVSLKTQRKIAKGGVLVTLGTLVWTGMQRPRWRYMRLHTWAGVALLGLTFWHWSLYQPRSDKKPGGAVGRATKAPNSPRPRSAGG
jgi:hypothetical protein